MMNMADEIDELYRDILVEVFEPGVSHFSQFVRDRLEKYEINVRKEIVSRKINDRAPLFYACLKGKVEMVEFLISTYDADVEQRGYYSGLDKEMVSPLWWAVVTGQKPIIECLLRHGADVNAISEFGKTPVQAVCMHFDNSDRMEYLVEHGADIHRADDHGRTCLMVAIHDVKMCEFLLKNGAEVDARDRRNKTALHYAIESVHGFETVKLLLDYGADVTLRSLDNDDALQAACIQGYRSIFVYLVEHGSYSPGRLADANELMGSRYSRDTHKTLTYWRKAIEIRNSNAVDGKPLAKTPSMPKRDCYRNASEFTSLDELDAIALDSDALNIQRLLIRERILGEHHRATFNTLVHLGDSQLYTEPSRYQDCFDLRRRALEKIVVNDSILWVDVAYIAPRILGTLYNLNERTLEVADCTRDDVEQSRFANVMAIFKLLTSCIVTAEPSSLKKLVQPESDEVYGYDTILQCITHLIDLLVKTARTSKAEDQVRALVRHLVNHQNLISPLNHDTLLHLSVSQTENSEYSIMSYFLNFDGPIFSNVEVTQLLLECKADVHARNEDGKTPLHKASCSEDFSDQILQLLLDHGAHLDTPDKWGRTPAYEIYMNPDYTLNFGNYITLRCLAAQVIVKHEIPCDDLPATLNQFVDIHRQYKSKQRY